jgi:hypothetical protein
MVIVAKNIPLLPFLRISDVLINASMALMVDQLVEQFPLNKM